MTLVYIGCGIDFYPVERIPDIEKFIYIDSLPQSQYGHKGYVTGINSKKYYLDIFRKNVPTKFCKINMEKTYPDIYKNYNTGQEIYHYYNLPFPWNSIISQKNITMKEMELLSFLIRQATHLVVSNHDPHVDILTLLPRKFILVTSYNSSYPTKEESSLEQELEERFKYPTLFSEFNEVPIQRRRIEKILHIQKEGISEFRDYEDFMAYHVRGKT